MARGGGAKCGVVRFEPFLNRLVRLHGLKGAQKVANGCEGMAAVYNVRMDQWKIELADKSKKLPGVQRGWVVRVKTSNLEHVDTGSEAGTVAAAQTVATRKATAADPSPPARKRKADATTEQRKRHAR